MNTRYSGLLSVLLILLSVICVNADDKSIDGFMQDINKFIEYPANNCKISNELKNIVINDKWIDSTVLDFDISIECNNSNVNENFKLFINKYEEFIDSNITIIDDAILSQYPDMFLWNGHNLNAVKDSYINPGLEYNASQGNDNKKIYFTIKTSTYETSVLVASFTGHMVSIYDENPIQNGIFHYSIKITKHTIANINPSDIQINRVWHIQKNEKAIKAEHKSINF